MATIEKKTAARSSDERLIKQCLAGNESAWAQLIEKYKSLIFSIPIKYGLPQQEAADVFQATCMELLARMAEIREPRALPKWLIQVAHHKCYHWKHQESRTVSRDTETGIPEPEAPPVAESLLRQTQEEQALREAMGTLKPRCRRLIELLFFEIPARPYAEIAGDLGLAVGSIGFTRQQCLETLRRQLEKSGFA
jgi:RNA polymerase sigma factor (sigma-70 family)